MRHFRHLRVASLAALVATPWAAGANAQPAASNSINIPFEKLTLPNGLNVILSVDHSIPQVAVNVWYHVGSKNELPGRTGFAHMFEHVMFTGSGHVPYGMHDRLTEGVGGNNNGGTGPDHTEYWENVPSNYLESAFWLESDRMGFLLDKLDSAKFVAQRDVVENERRQSVDNQPYGRAFEIETAALYPDSNRYSWPVVGYMSDLQHATVDDVKNFFRLYYAPSNATLAVVGDFDLAQAKAWITKYFGDLPKGAPITRPQIAPPTVATERRLVYEDRVQVPRLYIAWPTVGTDNDDTYALDVLSDILTGARTARLTKALVYDQQSATSVNAFNASRENGADFYVIATPREGHTLEQLEASTDSVIARIKAEGPTPDELKRSLAGLEFQFVSRLESNLGKSEILNEGLVDHGDAGHYKTDYARMRAVTAADVKRVANKYLGKGRAVLSIVPMGKTALASNAQASLKVTVAPDGGHYIMESR